MILDHKSGNYNTKEYTLCFLLQAFIAIFNKDSYKTPFESGPELYLFYSKFTFHWKIFVSRLLQDGCLRETSMCFQEHTKF